MAVVHKYMRYRAPYKRCVHILKPQRTQYVQHMQRYKIANNRHHQQVHNATKSTQYKQLNTQVQTLQHIKVHPYSPIVQLQVCQAYNTV